MDTLILFYKYINIEHPHQILKWQKQLATELDLKGRVILAHEGINGILGGNKDAINTYIANMNEHELFKNIDFKITTGASDCFPRLRIVIKNEIVHLGLDTQKYSNKHGGIHLTPEQTHAMLQQKSPDLILLDARNNYESRIGTFTDAITPDIDNFRDLPRYIDNNLEQFKDKKVLMFCTGGVRCERATAYLKEKNVAQEVYQMEGGIERYVQKYPDGFFRGKNYVFDARVAVKINEDILSYCYLCNAACDDYSNCMNSACNKQFICCLTCHHNFDGTCSTECKDLVANNKVPKRPAFKKAVITRTCRIK